MLNRILDNKSDTNGISHLQVRVDTGATTSLLHVDNIEEFLKYGKRWVRFDIHPDIHNVKKIVTTIAPLQAKKIVKSSSADKEKRVVINTIIKIGQDSWPIKLTLTDRSTMTYLMLLGREAMKDHSLILQIYIDNYRSNQYETRDLILRTKII